MNNLLKQPAFWQDADGDSPPKSWNGEFYEDEWSGENKGYAFLKYVGPTVTANDVFNCQYNVFGTMAGVPTSTYFSLYRGNQSMTGVLVQNNAPDPVVTFSTLGGSHLAGYSNYSMSHGAPTVPFKKTSGKWSVVPTTGDVPSAAAPEATTAPYFTGNPAQLEPYRWLQLNAGQWTWYHTLQYKWYFDNVHKPEHDGRTQLWIEDSFIGTSIRVEVTATNPLGSATHSTSVVEVTDFAPRNMLAVWEGPFKFSSESGCAAASDLVSYEITSVVVRGYGVNYPDDSIEGNCVVVGLQYNSERLEREEEISIDSLFGLSVYPREISVVVPSVVWAVNYSGIELEVKGIATTATGTFPLNLYAYSTGGGQQ